MRTSISTTFVLLTRWARRNPSHHVRCISHHAGTTVHSSPPFVSSPTFESIGIRAPIASALHLAFPNIKHPTKAQTEFIPAILSGEDVLLKDATGTGKSFGVILALLSKARTRSIRTQTGIVNVNPFITSLVIVPHRDLAYQFHHWIERLVMLSGTPGHIPPLLASIVQVIVRGGDTSMASQQEAILAKPPHILIGTPQALLESVKDGSISRAQMQTIPCVYVDEVDYLVESVPTNTTKRTQEKIKRRMERHPGATDQVLDFLFTSRRKKWRNDAGHGASQVSPSDSPQLIMSSATLRHHLTKRLCGGNGWINRGTVIKILGDGQPVSQTSSSNAVSHCILVVSKDGQVRNVDGALEPITTEVENGPEITAGEIFNSPDIEIELQEDEIHDKYANTELKLNRNALEVVAAAFALDVPSVALLSLPSSAPVQRAVHELRDLGVNAYSLDLLVADKGRAHLLQGSSEVSDDPIMLVSTTATTRGLDLPELTHVFMLGLPKDRRADTYLHIAGRAGRFGRPGKVITVVDEREEERKKDGTLAWARDDPKRMVTLLAEIGIAPRRFEHFE